jgi:hypothetical protein
MFCGSTKAHHNTNNQKETFSSSEESDGRVVGNELQIVERSSFVLVMLHVSAFAEIVQTQIVVIDKLSIMSHFLQDKKISLSVFKFGFVVT